VPDCFSVLRFAPAIKIISRTIGKIFDRLYGRILAVVITLSRTNLFTMSALPPESDARLAR
jgi:hypothetical protein